MEIELDHVKRVFFIGVAGAGMSAIAQYLAGSDKIAKGSDRYFLPGVFNETKDKLEKEGIECFLQDGTGIDENTDLVVVSTAIEDTVVEVQKAKQLNIPIIKRAALLALITRSKKTIAIGGTSGKSTTSAMLFDMLEYAGLKPGIISGAGLVSIIREGKIGNAKVGAGDWLVIEADESDGSIVEYEPEIGVLLNVDKDHQEIDELMRLFGIFKNKSKHFIVNQSNGLAKTLSENPQFDFSSDTDSDAGYIAEDFKQERFTIQFSVRKKFTKENPVRFQINSIGRHNMENALAAATIANRIGVGLQTCADALKNYEGIYRRNQVLGQKNGVWVIDDYAHNPVKCAAAIAACQHVAPRVVAWFQPHGYGPTRFLKDDFVREISAVLRNDDEIWMSEIFYAGGTADKNISAKELIDDIAAKGKKAYFVEDRSNLLNNIRPHLGEDAVLLLMGARDPSLEEFGKGVFEKL